MTVSLSQFASCVEAETAFNVLATARKLKASGKEVIELEIGDSPFPTPASATEAGIQAIRSGHCHYGPSTGLAEFRQAAAKYVNREYDLNVAPGNIIAGPGGKTFELLFCEAFVDHGQGVLVFSPHFPTYPPNINRRGGRITYAALEQKNQFRPNLDDVARFLDEDPNPKAIFLNSPHNPTGGVATPDDLKGLADLIRGRDIALFSDEPYDQMVWNGKHHSILSQPGMLDQCVGAYTFSKSFSMSGWRLGFAVASEATIDVFSTLTNTAFSCVPPFTQHAGIAAMQNDLEERDRQMNCFRDKVVLLVDALNQVDGITCLMPAGTFYAFASVAVVCNRLKITSHGLAMYLLEAADDQRGVACLGGECFGEAGGGFLRFSCAEPDQQLLEAVSFLATAIRRTDRVQSYLDARPEFRLATAYTP